MTSLVLISVTGLDWADVNARLSSGAHPKLRALAARGVFGWIKGARGVKVWRRRRPSPQVSRRRFTG